MDRIGGWMRSWDEVRSWRRAQRGELIGRRMAVPRATADGARDAIGAALQGWFAGRSSEAVGFYWPFRGELDMRPLVRHLIAAGHRAALPVVVARAQPLEFWAWQPSTPLRRDVWDIPVPAERAPLRPTVLLVPLVGFDAAGYRLGYGGGYYDRTLAAMAPQPLAIGLGLELGRLASIHPQAHDVPMDAIATERGVVWPRR